MERYWYLCLANCDILICRRSFRENKRARSRSPRRPLMGRELNSDKMVYISNIPYDVRWMELKDLVREKAGDVAYVEMIENFDGKSKVSFGFVYHPRTKAQVRRNDAQDDVLRNVALFFKKVKDETGIDFFANRSYSAPVPYAPVEEEVPPMSDGYETYGLSPLFLSRLGIQPPLTNRVFVSNVPFSAGTTKIRDVFSIAGKVTFVELPLDKTGKSKGVAVVEYSHPVEAVQAVSMLNNQKYFEKALNVRMDTIPPKPPSEMRNPTDLPHGLKGVGLGLGANGMPLTDISQVLGIEAGNAYGPATVNSMPFGSGGPGSQGVGMDMGGAMGYARGFHGLQSAVAPAGGSIMGPMNSAFPNPNCMPGSMNGSGGSGGYRNLPSLLSGPPYDPTPAIHSQASAPRFIIIRNLPPDYTWQTLRDRLRSFGDIEFAGIVQPGVGKIRFKSPRDAERAAGTLNGMQVEGRPIAVDLAIND
ncbi:RRM 1 domain containing protein [Trichuris trichiura]|uniref:RRM 1 domain containing protein n=1 Tax=Trichuris trichiura TaxID=36087 RepID=A0A077ZD02_TRITR|nr:RRM 1 domain containing protein [Trichuris trichiura]